MSNSNQGKLYLVHTPIGNLGDLTERARKVLEKVEVILCEDTRTTQRLLQALAIKGKRLLSFHEHNEEKRIPEVLKLLQEGNTVALLAEAGAPLLQDPGYLLVKRVAEAGFSYTVLPGATAVINALLLSGLPPLPFAFFGFLPHRASNRRRFLEKVAAWEDTLVLFLSPHRLQEELKDLAHAMGERPAALIREMTKIHEEVIRLEQLNNYPERLPERIRGEWVVVVGPAPRKEEQKVGQTLPWEFSLALKRVAAGESPRRVAQELAEKTGIPFRSLYKELLKGKT